MITLITEPKDYSKKAIRAYQSLGRVYFLPELTGDKKRAVMRRAHILVAALKYRINGAWFDAMPKLKIIAINTTGLNHIDVQEARKRGIKIISLKGQSGFLKYVPSTAEETMGLVFASLRNLPWAFEHVKGGGWKRDLFKGRQLFGKTIGLLGFGRLGKIVAGYAKAFGMNAIAYDPYVPRAAFARHGARRVSLRALFRDSDILSVHVYLTDETKNMVQEKHLRLMKPHAHLINTARGEIIDEKALLTALKRKWIAGAALDVLANESADGAHLVGNPLVQYARDHRNLIIVPHIGGATYEAMQVTQEFIAELVAAHVDRSSRKK